MNLSRPARWGLGAAAALVLAFVYVPLAVVLVNSFNASKVFAWPPKEFTTHWWKQVIGNPGIREAVLTSFEVGVVATLIALVLGTLLSFALARYRFFGQQTLSLLVVLPIALPGIVTALAFRTAFRSVLGVELSMWTVAVSHATFCIVVVYNNVIARLRRSSRSIEEASMDLGADTWQTFRHVTFPVIRTALIAGGLLAFALSFDEIIVTTFTAGTQETLPIWILSNLSRPNQRPIVNVVAVVLILLSAAPVYLASRLSGSTGVGGSRT